MRLKKTLVFRMSPEKMYCTYCQAVCIKKGIRNSKQKYFCKTCHRYQQKEYSYLLCTKEHENTIVKLNNESVGISGIARLTGISKANVVNKLKQLNLQTHSPIIQEQQQEYEVDEMYTYIQSKDKPCYITYAINKRTKQVINLVVGSRTKENLSKVITSLNKLNPKKIYTDKLNIYLGLIEKSIHVPSAYKINHIERFNLTLRTHLKRLTRRTICFSKSLEMLESCLRIYFYKTPQIKNSLFL